ncbi:MAG: hypothetical protein ACPIOQ_19990 [Promethearchaeia archaeon]
MHELHSNAKGEGGMMAGHKREVALLVRGTKDSCSRGQSCESALHYRFDFLASPQLQDERRQHAGATESAHLHPFVTAAEVSLVRDQQDVLVDSSDEQRLAALGNVSTGYANHRWLLRSDPTISFFKGSRLVADSRQGGGLLVDALRQHASTTTHNSAAPRQEAVQVEAGDFAASLCEWPCALAASNVSAGATVLPQFTATMTGGKLTSKHRVVSLPVGKVQALACIWRFPCAHVLYHVHMHVCIHTVLVHDPPSTILHCFLRRLHGRRGRA